jgi:16S rRNA (uracil1498-N3)-methyltransferase
MTRRRWIADEVNGDRAYLNGAHAAHLARVLRARVGQEFDIAAGGRLRRGRVLAVSDERVEFELGEIVEAVPLAEFAVLLSVIKFDRMEWALEKLAELGVSNIVPLIARRTDAHLAAAAHKRVERWRRIALEASEQSRRAQPPRVAPPAKLRQALALDADCRLLLDERQSSAPADVNAALAEGHGREAVAPMIRDALDTSSPAGSIALAVGPEGGWAEEELEAFAAAGWRSVSLGKMILRTETAAIAAVAALRALQG